MEAAAPPAPSPAQPPSEPDKSAVRQLGLVLLFVGLAAGGLCLLLSNAQTANNSPLEAIEWAARAKWTLEVDKLGLLFWLVGIIEQRLFNIEAALRLGRQPAGGAHGG